MAYDWSALKSVNSQDGGPAPEARPLAPIGKHDFVIMEAEKKASGPQAKTPGAPYINLKMRISGGDYADVYGVVALPDDARPDKSNDFLERNFVAFLEVLGIDPSKAEAVVGRVDGLVLKSGKVHLKKDDYANPVTGETKEKRQPDWIRSAAAGSIAAAPAPAESTPQRAGEDW